MSILNLNEASKLYYGGTEAQRLYKGAELIYPQPSFSPLNLSPALWLDADDSSTITLVSGAVSEWRDKSGNNRHAIQNTASLRPTLITNIDNVQYLNFSNHWLYIPLYVVGKNSSDKYTMFVVNQHNSNTTRGGLVSTRDAPTLPAGILFSNDRSMSILFAQISTGNVVAPISNPLSVAFCLVDIPSHQVGVDGIVISTGSLNHTPTPVTRTLIGKEREGVERHLQGIIGDILIFDRILSQTELDLVNGWLHHKNKIVGQLPTNHPYKAIAP